MVSRVLGGARVRRALKRLPAEIRGDVAKALKLSVAAVQATAIRLAPVDTGNLREALADPRAIGIRDAGMRVEFGFRTKAIQRKAFYAPFVEFGTKGYQAGDHRRSGTDRHGRQLYKRVRRFVPARPAQPFMRPALDMNLPTIRRLINHEVRRAVARARGG